MASPSRGRSRRSPSYFPLGKAVIGRRPGPAGQENEAQVRRAPRLAPRVPAPAPAGAGGERVSPRVPRKCAPACPSRAPGREPQRCSPTFDVCVLVVGRGARGCSSRCSWVGQRLGSSFSSSVCCLPPASACASPPRPSSGLGDPGGRCVAARRKLSSSVVRWTSSLWRPETSGRVMVAKGLAIVLRSSLTDFSTSSGLRPRCFRGSSPARSAAPLHRSGGC